MCGFFGTIHFDQRPVFLEDMRRRTNRLRHRGPDDEGYLLVQTSSGRMAECGGADTDDRLRLGTAAGQDDRFDCGLGFRRLSIIDLSVAGHQPMRSADGRLAIVFNGEIYNYRELREELKGYPFRSETDTEVILAAYDAWGLDALSRFNGMWAFALWDGRRRTVILARDRFGIKPLYYRRGPSELSFASEMKALVERPGDCSPDSRAIYRYLVAGMLPSPREGATFLTGIVAVPPATVMDVDAAGRLSARRYWALAGSPGARRPHVGEVVREYRELFSDAVRLRLRSDVPVGTCLSGGLDSSAIACTVDRLIRDDAAVAPQVGPRQRTFSAVYTTPGRHDERSYIDKVVQAIHGEPQFIYPTGERLRAEMEALVWHQEEPFGSSSIFAQWCVMRQVRESGTTVLLDGQGADEMLGGYRPYVNHLRDMLGRGQLLAALRESKRIEVRTGLPWLDQLRRSLSCVLPGPVQARLRRRRDRSVAALPMLNPDLVREHRGETEVDWRSWGDQDSLSAHLLDLLEETSLPHLLRYEDRNSMAFSVEARLPYLDYRLAEFSFGPAADHRLFDGWTKWVLRKAAEDVVPPEIAWRRDKVGFETPEALWLQEWRASGMQLFDDAPRSEAFLALRPVRERIRAADLANPEERASIWRWINLEAWLRVWA